MKKVLVLILLFFSSSLIGCNTNSTTLTEDYNTLEISYYVFDENVNTSDNNYLDIDEEVSSLKAGLYHSILLTSTGRVFTWGDNEFGQLGNETLESKLIPTEITSFFNLDINEKITQVSIGAFHTSALTSNHRIFMWGYNEHSQLGDGTFGPFAYKTKPKDITNEFNLNDEEYIESIELGSFHSSAKTSH